MDMENPNFLKSKYNLHNTPEVKKSAERMAINMPTQGLAADIMKLAMIAVTRELRTNERRISTNDIKMILQIHDEIILEVKEALADEVAKKVKEIMESVYKLKIPLVANVKIGDNWGEI